jgi:protein jagunal, putative
MHILLFVLMMIKLSDDILDRLDIFILELQGLYIPKPLAWEWIWSSSILLTFIAKRAMKKNDVALMKLYGVLIFLMSLSPVLYAFGYFFNDFYSFVLTKDIKQVSEKWQKYPLALLWYVFLAISFQVHISQIIFAFILTHAWSVKKGKKE